MTEPALIDEPNVGQIKGSVRVEDKMKLRELELQTQYELKYLSNNFTDLRRYVETKLDTESDKFEMLNKKVNWLMYIVLAQLAGVSGESIAPIVKSLLVP